MRRHSLSLAVLIVLGSLSSAQSGEGRDVAEGWRTWASNLAVAGLTVSVGAVREENGGRTTVVEDVSIAFNLGGRPWVGTTAPAQQSTASLLIHVPVVRLEDLRRVDGGVSASAIEIPSATTRWEAPFPPGKQIAEYQLQAISMDGSFLPALPEIDSDRARPFSRLEPLFKAALKVSSKRLAVGSIELRSSVSGVQSKAIYGAIVAEDIRAGAVQRLSQEGIEIDFSGVSADVNSGRDRAVSPFKVSIGPLYATHYSIAPFVSSLFDGEIPDGDAGLATREFVQSGFTISGEGFSFRIGSITASDIRMSGKSEALASKIDALISSKDHQSLGIAEDFDINMLMIMPMSMALLEIRNIAADTPQMIMSASSLTFENLSKDGIRSIVMRGLNASSTPDTPLNKLTMHQASVTGVVFPSKTAIMNVMRFTALQQDGQAQQQPSARMILDMLPMFGSFIIDDYSFTVPGGAMGSVDRLELTMRDPIAPIPTSVSASIVGMELPSSIGTPPMRAFLEDAGVESLHIDMRLEAEWSDESSALTIAPLTYSVAGLGTLALNLQLSGIPRSVFEDPSSLKTAVPSMMVDGLQVRYGNAPKLAGPLEAQARQQSLSVGDMIRSLGATVREQAAPQTGEPFATMAASAFEEFLTGPTGSLELVARPPQPVPLVQVVGAATMAPGSLVKLLNAVVEYRP